MALESLLGTLKEYNPHRLVCLFGCGGNRSRDRRFEMGEVSGKLADLTIITSDNPRNEEPQAIIDDIKTGISKTEGKYVESNEQTAENQVRYAAWTQVIDNCTINEYPETLVEVGKKLYEQQVETYAKYAGMELDAYIESSGLTQEETAHSIGHNPVF